VAGTQGGAFAGQAAAAAAATAAPAPPDATQLHSALLTAADLGPSFSALTGAGGGSPSTVAGCEALTPLLTGAPAGAPNPDEIQQDASLQAGQNGPFIDEALLTEAPAAVAADYARNSAALKSCKAVSLSSGGTTLDFKLSPITFAPAASSTATRMDGSLDGVEINGYLAVSNLGGVEAEYFYLQFDNGSSQLASHFFTMGVDKARTTLSEGASTGPGGSPSTEPAPSPAPSDSGAPGVGAAPLSSGWPVRGSQSMIDR
jgi:hypothetical protein